MVHNNFESDGQKRIYEVICNLFWAMWQASNFYKCKLRQLKPSPEAN